MNKRESTGVQYFNDSKAFIKCSNVMEDIYKNIEEYNPNKKQKILIAFNHSSDIDFDDFVNIYKKCFAKPYSFLVSCNFLASDNPSRF